MIQWTRAVLKHPLPRHVNAHHIGQPAPQRVLSERDPEGTPKFLPELFVFVADPRVPATNNAAE
jgi:hypothetical protein